MVQESRLAIVIDSRTAEQRANDLKTVLDHLEQSGSKATVTLRDMGDSAKSMGDKSKSAANSIGEMATALGSVVSVGKLWAQIEKATFAAGRYDQLGIIMEVVGRNAGHSAEELAGLQSELEATGISMSQSRQVITRLMQANIDLAQATQLARLAQDAATIGNISSSEALDRLVIGIQTSQVEILRNVGIVTNFENAYKGFAAELGRTVASLTEQEKMQARVNAVMAQGPAIAGAYEASMENANKQMGSMERHADNLSVKLGEAYQPAFALVIEQMTAALKLAGNNAGALSIGLAGVTAAVATATTGILALRAGAVALNVALGALRAHPVIMGLSIAAGAAAAAGVAFSGMGGDARVAAIDLDELTRALNDLNAEQIAFRRQQAEEKLESLEEKAAEAARELRALERDYAALMQMFEEGRGVDAEGLENVNKTLVEQRARVADANQEVEKAQGVLAQLDDAARAAAAGVDTLNAALRETDDAGRRYLERLTDQSIVAGLKTQRQQLEALVKAGKLVYSDEDLEAARRAADIIDAARGGGSRKTKADTGADYLKDIQERIALLGKETEYEQLLARVASGALIFRTEKQREVAEMLAKQLDDTQKQIEMEEVLRDLREQQSTTQMQFMRELEAFGQGERVRQLNADLAKVEDRYRGIIDARRNSPLGLSDEELAQIRESLQVELEMVREFHEQKLAIQQDWSLGARDALINYADEAANVYDSVGRLASKVFRGMEDALTEFVRTGKLSFSDLADSIIRDMIRIAIQQSVTGPLAMAFSGWLSGPTAPAGVTPGLDWTFATGGYTGDGGKFEPAGIVHRGEGVLNQEEIRALGGEAGFNALRRALRTGHAFGGMAGRPSLPPAVAPAAAPSVEVNIVNQSGQPVGSTQQQVRMDDAGRMIIDVMLTDLRRNGPYARQLKGALA